MSDVRETLNELSREVEAAKVLRDQLRDIAGDDADLVRDCIEGETGLHEAIEAAAKQIAADTAAVKGVTDFIETMNARKDRLKKRIEGFKVALRVAMEAGGIKSKELAFATLSRRAVPPSAIVTDESAIPSRFWRSPDPVLDKKALLDALKGKEDVPGAALSNGAECLAVKWS